MISMGIDALSAKSSAASADSTAERSPAIALLYAATAVMVVALTAQRSFFPHPHWTFWIFRASFWHLLHQQNLYARYGSHDLFKYSPTAALPVSYTHLTLPTNR